MSREWDRYSLVVICSRFLNVLYTLGHRQLIMEENRVRIPAMKDVNGTPERYDGGDRVHSVRKYFQCYL